MSTIPVVDYTNLEFSNFELEEDYALINDEEFKILREKNTKAAFFAERIAVRGILNFGLVKKNIGASLDLQARGIKTAIIIDSIVAISSNSTADEIIFELYRKVNGEDVKVGIQRYSNNQMPVDFPDGIIYPDMTIKVIPQKNDATITVYCKPVFVAFSVNADGTE